MVHNDHMKYMKDYEFAFVVLNYNCTEETIRCVESLIALKDNNICIIIVDNCSKDKDGFWNLMKQKFGHNQNVFFLSSVKNIGYARGNNIGIAYAKYHLDVDFVILLNPDTIVKDEKIVNKITETYSRYPFAIMGPQILANGRNANPGRGYNSNRIKMIRGILINVWLYYVKKFNLGKWNLLKRTNRKKLESGTRLQHDERSGMTHYIESQSSEYLVGACLVFSPLFLDEYSGLCNRTFLYVEEAILKYVASNLKLPLLYCDDIIIYHEGGKSTETMYVDEREKIMFGAKHGGRSSWEYFKIALHNNSQSYMKEILNPVCDNYIEITK